MFSGTATLSGVFGSDNVTLRRHAVRHFADKKVGNMKPVTFTGFNIGGANSGNYALSQPSGLTANITPAPLTISRVVAVSKIYDGTTAAALTGSALLSGIISSNIVTVGGAPAAGFLDKNVGNNKPVTVTGYTLGGTDSGNYTLSQPSGLTANIVPATLIATADTKTITVGDAVPPLTYTISGFVNGEMAPAVVSGMAVCGTPATSSSPISGYPSPARSEPWRLSITASALSVDI